MQATLSILDLSTWGRSPVRGSKILCQLHTWHESPRRCHALASVPPLLPLGLQTLFTLVALNVVRILLP